MSFFQIYGIKLIKNTSAFFTNWTESVEILLTIEVDWVGEYTVLDQTFVAIKLL